jgi:hypothetical protein
LNTAFWKNESRNRANQSIGNCIFAVLLVVAYLTACTSQPGKVTNTKPFKMDTDLAKVVIGPADVTDFFQGVTYSISQAIVSPQSRGVIVTYPTEFLAHTTAFAFGFQSRIEIFQNINQAVKSYGSFLAQQSGKPVAMNTLGDTSRAFSRPSQTPEGYTLDSTEYAVLFRERNAVVSIILRTDKNVSAARLGQLAELVISRLQP